MPRLSTFQRFAASRSAVLILAAVALGAGASPAAAAQAKRCDELRGPFKIKTAKIKVVERKVDDRKLDGTRLLGCALPRGKVRVLGGKGVPSDASGLFAVSYAVGAHAGRFLDVRRDLGDGSLARQENIGAVVDLRPGRRRTYFRAISAQGFCGDYGTLSPYTPPVTRVVLAASGAFAVLYSNPTGAKEVCAPHPGKALLLGFPEPATADRMILALAPIRELPPASVRVAGQRFSWTRAGQAESANGALYPGAR